MNSSKIYLFRQYSNLGCAIPLTSILGHTFWPVWLHNCLYCNLLNCVRDFWLSLRLLDVRFQIIFTYTCERGRDQQFYQQIPKINRTTLS